MASTKNKRGGLAPAAPSPPQVNLGACGRVFGQEIGCEVIIGYNEFCAPSLDEALDRAATRGAKKIVVVTPMMTPGGEHAEEDIPTAIMRAEGQHPAIVFAYAWPFGVDAVARFLAAQVEQLS